MHGQFVSRRNHLPKEGREAATSMARRQERSGQNRPDSVSADSAGPPDLGQEPRTQESKDGSTGGIRPEGHEKGGLDPMSVQQAQQSRHPDPEAVEGADINF